MSDRLSQVFEACADEIRRFNEALKTREVRINNPALLSHGQRVLQMRPDFWLVTETPNGDTRSWYYANNGRWAALLEQAGVERHPLFADAP